MALGPDLKLSNAELQMLAQIRKQSQGHNKTGLIGLVVTWLTVMFQIHHGQFFLS